MKIKLGNQLFERMRQWKSPRCVGRSDTDSELQAETTIPNKSAEQNLHDSEPISDHRAAPQSLSREKRESNNQTREKTNTSESQAENIEEPDMSKDNPKGAFLEIDITPLLHPLQSIQEGLGEITNSVTEISESDEIILHQSETLKEMSGRIRALEDNQVLENILKPIFRDLLLLYDGVIQAREKLAAPSGETSEHICVPEILQGMEKEILDALARHDVFLMKDTTQQIDPKKQKVVGVTQSISSEEGMELSPVRQGFYCGGQVLRPQEVIVHRSQTKEV